jgi:3-oxoacyl-[acyl-carrier-protein] synthase-3
MDGMAVFNFAVKEIPILIDELCEAHNISKDYVDYFLLHQPNAYMLKHIAKRSGIKSEKMPVNIGSYGNTDGATIPFLVCDMAEVFCSQEKDVLMAGFGIGLSWSGIVTRLGKLECAEIIHIG